VDGKASPLRNQSKICIETKQYDQQALVLHFEHERPHNDTAFELFFKEGPLAVLPLHSETPGVHRSGMVWCREKSFDFKTPTDDDLTDQFQKLFPYLGAIRFQSKRWIYPLSYTKVLSLVDHRLALAGDAGHVMHPIAGQGVNLGWRDAAELITILRAAKSQGIDLGCPYLLKKYDSARKRDRLSLLWMTDTINSLYQITFPPLSFARNAAFAVLNHMKPVKRAFMRRAMGLF
jgi:2-octaprenyl-6-methoxyphenol hydroxylase